MSTETKKDDLEAIKQISQALEGFRSDEQWRILRYACQRLGIKLDTHFLGDQPDTGPLEKSKDQAFTPHAASQRAPDIRSFFNEKQPKSDIQFAATVAFYYRFVAPLQERKEDIGSEELLEACRAIPRERVNPKNTFNNAYNAGLLDRVARGRFKINTVGENLVAMTLPGGAGNGSKPKKPRKKNRKSVKKKRA